jgi:hypothetical protein
MRLDPSGYIDRELKRKRLDNRSRLAQSALGRLRNNVSNNEPRRGDTDGRDNQRFQSGNGPRVGNTAVKPGANKNPNNPNWSQIPAEQADPNSPVDPFKPPKVDLNGKLIPMPWEMQMDWIQSARDLAQQNADWDFEVGQSQLQHGNAMRDLALQRIVDNRNIAGGNASRGMSFSSGNAQDIQETANQYARAESDAGSWLQGIMGQYGVGGVQRGLAQSNFDQYAAMLQAEAARRLAARAGTLGLGQDNTAGGSKPKPDKDKGKGGKGDGKKGDGKKGDGKGKNYNPPGSNNGPRKHRKRK